MTIAPTRDAWRPGLGAWPEGPVTHFRVWAPATRRVELVIERSDRRTDSRAMDAAPAGFFTAALHDAPPGTRYRYALDGRGPFPDPASRFQPDGVHGPSLVVNPRDFVWTDREWDGCPLDELAIYELHVGSFTPAGTFAGVETRLPYLRDLGVTGVELMPIADFPGERNWGYDGAALFAPARCYGTPDDLRRLVDAAHRLGLAVLLDVVYNHVGPDGAWLHTFSPYYFSERHTSPWGAAVNLDGAHSAAVRDFFIENALHWVHEYHVDGFRLDATHAMRDGSPRHFVAELAARVRAERPHRPVLLIAEDHRNLTQIVRPVRDGGWGMDAVWADDLHHELRRLLAGDSDGYYADYDGTTADIARTIRQGWFFTGQHSTYLGESRGTDPAGIPLERFVVCLQNHDQIGNRAFGERLHHQIDLASFRSASVLLFTAPETPLIFMGQEWAAGAPFCYFTDHAGELGRLVTEGRRREFDRFAAFSDPAARDRIPDPQAKGTFLASRLDWRELDHEPHAGMRRLYAALLSLRRREPGLRASGHGALQTSAPDGDSVVVRRSTASEAVYVVACLRGAGSVTLDAVDPPMSGRDIQWTCLLDSEDPRFTTDAMPPTTELSGPAPVIRFARPSAVVLRARPATGANAGWSS